jgi:regulatory protein
MQAALRLLRSRDRTEAEIRTALSAKGFEDAEIGLVLVALTKYRYVDDSRVAERTVERASRDQSGRLLVEHKLSLRGVAEEEIVRALASLPEETDLAEEAFWKSRKPGDTPARAAARLARKGFDEDTVRTVIERHFPEFG